MAAVFAIDAPRCQLMERNSVPEKRKKGKPFQLQFGWGGLFSIIVVACCLFLWMFLLGLWAGQTVLLPARPEDGRRLAEERQVKDRESMQPAAGQRKPVAPVAAPDK